ncbi:MAG: serine/threonine protein kinase [Planctomycetota bacterium]|nr:MAG: serine/threonine protein kinase [Planctomycetota bacterium]
MLEPTEGEEFTAIGVPDFDSARGVFSLGRFTARVPGAVVGVDQLPLTVFRRSALASGLLTVEQILEAEKAVRAGSNAAGVQAGVDDEQLAAKLVEQGLINRWQAEQLKVGRAKFNLGPYQVIDSIGQGGMGQVFRAEHRLMGRIVAIKVLPRHRSTPDAIASFTREIRAQAKFDHQNLVRAFDAGHDGNVYFLVTEYVPGADLRKLVRARGKLSMQDAATIISQAAHGLAHAHRGGMVHRDVKPGNLLVTPDGQTKVSDLGLASFLDAEDPDDPRAGRIVGTADYLSPEHITSPGKLSSASDIYSLGCTLYYAVTGKVPFPGGTHRDKARRHCEDIPLNPRRFNLDLTDGFVDVIASMMEKDPQKRLSSCEEVIRRLAPWARDSVHGDISRSPGSAQLRAPAPSLSDTEPGLFDDLPLGGTDESPSQISQPTDPVAHAGQETVPDFRDSGGFLSEEPQYSWPVVAAVVVPLLLGAAVLVGSIALKALQ